MLSRKCVAGVTILPRCEGRNITATLFAGLSSFTGRGGLSFVSLRIQGGGRGTVSLCRGFNCGARNIEGGFCSTPGRSTCVVAGEF